MRDEVDTDFWYNYWLGLESQLVFSCIDSDTPTSIVKIAIVKSPNIALMKDMHGWRWDHDHHFLSKWFRDCFTCASRTYNGTIDLGDCYSAEYGGSETVLHVLRERTMAQSIWETVIQPSMVIAFYDMPLHEWITDVAALWMQIMFSEEISDYVAKELRQSMWLLSPSLLWLRDRHVQSKIDNLEVVQILHKQSDALASYALVEAKILLLNRSWRVQVHHILRERNLVTDRIVAMRHGGSIGTLEFTTVHADIVVLVNKEAKDDR
ncbi:hypothetical protein V6N11_004016 [Hibiscus sabdariffa]|uniref:RNase H type-1 domain-containing protein n=1 Tax=Hibiscus sabdariffa TaxID=183260 RepID=A0ABR2SF57_9ROSI